MRRRECRCAFIALTFLLAFVSYLWVRPGVTRAQTLSPSITPSQVEVNTALARGAEHDLPILVVRNQTDGTMLIQMSTAFAGSEAPLVDPRSWIQFTPQQFELQATGSQAVAVRLHIPEEATTGPHTLLLRAGPSPIPGADGVSIGVSAFVATKLTFEVGPEVLKSPALPLYYLAAIGLAIAAGTGSYYFTAWASTIEVHVRRRQATVRPDTSDRPDSSPATTAQEKDGT